jgi:hypothetical protein
MVHKGEGAGAKNQKPSHRGSALANECVGGLYLGRVDMVGVG